MEQDVGEVVVVLVSAARARGRGLREQVASEPGDLNAQIALRDVEDVLAVVTLDVAGAPEIDRPQP
ncbi:MAG: hypothetical protein ABSB69_06975 [Solirubrobacteraceae bacterium]